MYKLCPDCISFSTCCSIVSLIEVQDSSTRASTVWQAEHHGRHMSSLHTLTDTASSSPKALVAVGQFILLLVNAECSFLAGRSSEFHLHLPLIFAPTCSSGTIKQCVWSIQFQIAANNLQLEDARGDKGRCRAQPMGWEGGGLQWVAGVCV